MKDHWIVKGTSCAEDMSLLDKILPKLDKLEIKLSDNEGHLKIRSIRTEFNRIVEGIAIHPYNKENSINFVSLPKKAYNVNTDLDKGIIKFCLNKTNYFIYKNQDTFEELTQKPKP
jgi:hypothetical protein